MERERVYIKAPGPHVSLFGASFIGKNDCLGKLRDGIFYFFLLEYLNRFHYWFDENVYVLV